MNRLEFGNIQPAGMSIVFTCWFSNSFNDRPLYQSRFDNTHNNSNKKITDNLKKGKKCESKKVK